MTFYFLGEVRGQETRAQRSRETRTKEGSRRGARAYNGRGKPRAKCSDAFLLVERFEKRLGILTMNEERHILRI
jgi:hypothetical protein